MGGGFTDDIPTYMSLTKFKFINCKKIILNTNYSNRNTNNVDEHNRESKLNHQAKSKCNLPNSVITEPTELTATKDVEK